MGILLIIALCAMMYVIEINKKLSTENKNLRGNLDRLRNVKRNNTKPKEE